MKTSDAVAMFNALTSLSGDPFSIKFAYACGRNRRSLEPLFDAFEMKRVSLAKQHAKRDEKGEPVVRGTDFDLADKVTVENITGGSLSEAPVVNFNVLKGVTS